MYLRIAGPAALPATKAIKISEGLERADTQRDLLEEKGSLDAYRILQAIDTADLVAGFLIYGIDEHAATITAEAVEI
ncbi:hypothetical protein [Brachybacterium sp. FME24]|uniref:hypothetical protein n=1 Tax=Brachybacterium sp. FME24 TaxID=2742605 RepID=UPI0018661F3B|nr:hypothetical protein [Brachybacterium sp. FME24]